jgi:hypothetical protein
VTSQVRIRVMVVIDPDGKWEAVGSHSWSDAATRDQVDDCSGDLGRAPWAYHWIEADVPIPVEVQDETVEGEVSPA